MKWRDKMRTTKRQKSWKQRHLYKSDSLKESNKMVLCRLKVTKVTVKAGKKIGKQINTVNNHAITVTWIRA